jgi:hypothetical protein
VLREIAGADAAGPLDSVPPLVPAIEDSFAGLLSFVGHAYRITGLIEISSIKRIWYEDTVHC